MAKLTLDKNKLNNENNQIALASTPSIYEELQKYAANSSQSSPSTTSSTNPTNGIIGLDQLQSLVNGKLPITSGTASYTNNTQPNKSIYDQLVDIANGKTNSTNPSDVKNSAQSIYDQMLSLYNQNQKDMNSYEKEMATTYLNNAELNLDRAENLYDSYVAAYENLSNSKAAAQVARDNAYKYTQQALNAQGLGTQGLAQSTLAGIGNQYANNVNDLNKSYNNQMYDAYSQYQNALRENNANALANRNAIQEAQKEEAIYNIESGFENATSPTEMKQVLDNNQILLGDDIYNSYKQQYVATMLENAMIENRTDVMYNAFGNYLMNNDVSNGQIFVLENEKGKDAHYFEYQNGELVELNKKDVETTGKSYIHFDSKGNIANQTYMDYSSLTNGVKTKVEKSGFKDASKLVNNTAFYSVIDGKEYFYLYKDGYIQNLTTSKLSDSQKQYIKQNYVEYKK